MRISALALTALLLAAALPGCGGAGEEAPSAAAPSPSPSAPTPTATPSPTPTPSAPPADPEDAEISGPRILPEIAPLVTQGPPEFDREMIPSAATLSDIPPLIPNDNPPFSPDDMVAGPLRQGMEQEELLALLGMPRRLFYHHEEATGYDFLTWECESGDMLSLCSTDGVYRLRGVQILSDLPGPRGIRVGDPAGAVLAAFRVDFGSLAGSAPLSGGIGLYAAGVHTLTWGPDYPYPPSGEILLDVWVEEGSHGDRAFVVSYDFWEPDAPEGSQEWAWILDEHAYAVMDRCVFTVCGGVVTHYTWDTYAGAE